MRKNIIRTYGVLAIFLVVFTVVVVAIPLSKNAAFWLSYLFVVIAIAVQGYAIYLGFSRKEPVSSKLYGFPVARVGFIYLIVQLLASVVFMILAPVMPIWVIVVVSVIALGAACAGLITTDAMRFYGKIKCCKRMYLRCGRCSQKRGCWLVSATMPYYLRSCPIWQKICSLVIRSAARQRKRWNMNCLN